MFLVTKKNRVIDYCEEGYIYVGNVVVCESKGCNFEDATIVYTEKELPADIDSIQYDYINGEFIRCEDPVDNNDIIEGLYGDNKVKVRPILKKLNPVAIGPVECEDNLVSNNYSSDNPDNLYCKLVGDPNTFLDGKYSYGFTRECAYRLDHTTRTAHLIVDLSDIINSTSYEDNTIFALDSQYIYLAVHEEMSYSADYFYGTIYKFNHTGDIISTHKDTYKKAWLTDGKSCFEHITSRITYYNGSIGGTMLRTFSCQTENYIVLIYYYYHDTNPSADSHEICVSYISKDTLKMTAWYRQGDNVLHWKFSSDNKPCISIIPHKDILIFNRWGYAAYSGGSIYGIDVYLEAFQLVDSSSPIELHSLHGTTATDNICGIDLQILDINGIKLGEDYYYKLKLGDYQSSGEIGCYYSIVHEDDIDFSSITSSSYISDFIRIPYITREDIPFDLRYYDPIIKDLSYRGVIYKIYPEYEPPINPPEMLSGYSDLPYFKIGDYYHFLNTSTNKIYKLDATTPLYDIHALKEI